MIMTYVTAAFILMVGLLILTAALRIASRKEERREFDIEQFRIDGPSNPTGGYGSNEYREVESLMVNVGGNPRHCETSHHQIPYPSPIDYSADSWSSCDTSHHGHHNHDQPADCHVPHSNHE